MASCIAPPLVAGEGQATAGNSLLIGVARVAAYQYGSPCADTRGGLIVDLAPRLAERGDQCCQVVELHLRACHHAFEGASSAASSPVAVGRAPRGAGGATARGAG